MTAPLRGRTEFRWLAAGFALTALSCGNPSAQLASEGDDGTSTTTTVSSSDPADGKRLEERRTAQEGQTIYDPPGDVPARHSEDEALALIRSDGSSGDLLDQGYTRESFFALYTDKAHGRASPDGEIILAYDQVPAWVVILQGVPSRSSGPPSGESAQPQPAVSADVTFVLEDATGKMLVTATEGHA